MRSGDLTATLLVAQKAMGDVLCKLVLTSGSTTKSYDIDSTINRIIALTHPEQEWSQTAQVLVDNRDANLTALALEGYAGVLSYGYHTGLARSAWVANTVYSLGDYVVPTTANGYQYKCTARTGDFKSGATEPTWGTTLGGTTSDDAITWTLDGKTGDEYSPTAPLTVIAQKNDTMFRPNGDLLTTFSLAGLFDLWGEQEATVAYAPDRINTDTVKTILDAIAGATLTCFSTYPAHTITYDTGYDDSIINAFTPKDAFSIGKGESRLSAFKKALAYTKCKARVENDAGVATIHIFRPTPYEDIWVASTGYSENDKVIPTTANGFEYICTTAGTSHSSEPTWPTTEGGTVTEGGGSTLVWTIVWYDYEYNDAMVATNHNFFIKSVRTRLVLPNKVVVMNHPEHTDSYTGTATDADSYAALGNQYYTETHYVRAASNAQCALIAAARLQGYQIAAEKGHGIAPMNVGQEVMDYVKITDSAAGDTRIGNIGFLQRNYRQGSAFEFEFRFGSLFMPGLAGTIPPRVITTGPRDPSSLQQEINALWQFMDGIVSNQQLIINFLQALHERTEFTHLSVTERFQGPMGADKYT